MDGPHVVIDQSADKIKRKDKYTSFSKEVEPLKQNMISRKSMV